MGRTRRLERCADNRSRAWRSGSIVQHRTLQYFAVAFLTGAVHPRRAHIRRVGCPESTALDRSADATGAVYECARAVCQPRAWHVSTRRRGPNASHAHSALVQTVDKPATPILRARRRLCTTAARSCSHQFLRRADRRPVGGAWRCVGTDPYLLVVIAVATASSCADAAVRWSRVERSAMVGAIGIEPMTSAMSTQRSYQLSYAPACLRGNSPGRR
jgi:hypothetical protein